MVGTLQATPWNFGPYGTLGSFASIPGSFGAVPNVPFAGLGIGGAAPWSSPVSHVLQQLQILPQQVQQLQQTDYIQQQLLQQILQILQTVPQQVQQVQQLIQYLPQHVAQLVQQALTSSSGILPGLGSGLVQPFGGLSTGTPLQSPVFGNPLQSMQPLTSTQFSLGQPGYVM